jgi:hypothetical protein
MRKAVVDAFQDTQLMVFGWLATEGFEVPTESNGWVWRSAPLRIDVDVAYNGFEDYVHTSLRDRSVPGRRSTNLEDLYVAAGLGPPQDLGHKALTGHSLAKVMESHSVALRRLLPWLGSSQRDTPPWRDWPGAPPWP